MFLKTRKIFVILFLCLVNQYSKDEKVKSGTLEKIEGSTQSSRTNNTKESKTVSSKLDYEKNQIVLGYNTEKLWTNSQFGNETRQQMQILEQKIIAELKPMAEKFEQMRQEYEQKAKTSKRDALLSDEEKIGQLAQEIQMKQMRSQDEYKAAEMTSTKLFLSEVAAACKDFLLSPENANVILLPIDSGVYIHAKYDLTDKILENMDIKFENNKKTKNLEVEKKKK